MTTIETIHARRSVKAYDAEHVMPADIEKQIFDAAMQAPTAFNIQHWRFVVVRDPEVRKQIRAVAWDQAQITDASLLVILTGDVKAWERDPARYWRDAPKEVADFLVGAIGQYYEGKPQVQRDEVMRSCGIAGMTLMLAAKSLGYDSCPMDGFDFDQVAKIIQLPEDHIISYIVAIGKGTKEPWPKPGQLEASEVIRVI